MHKVYYSIEELGGGFRNIELFNLDGNGEPVKFADYETTLKDIKKSITYYLEDNGYGDVEYEMIQL
jgi:hypothetical protein